MTRSCVPRHQVLAATLAARTSRIALGIGVMNPYSVHPAELAMMAGRHAAEQEAGQRRPVSCSGSSRGAAVPQLGGDTSRTAPLATTTAAVATVRALVGHHDVDRGLLPAWAREQCDAGAEVPAADRPVPVYVGAMGPRMLAMAGAHADAGTVLLYPPEQFAVARRGLSVLCRCGAHAAARLTCLPASGSRCPPTRRRALERAGGEARLLRPPRFPRRCFAEATGASGQRISTGQPRLAHTGQRAAALIRRPDAVTRHRRGCRRGDRLGAACCTAMGARHLLVPARRSGL